MEPSDLAQKGLHDARHDWRHRNSKLHFNKPWKCKFRRFESTPMYAKDPNKEVYFEAYQREWRRLRAEYEEAVKSEANPVPG